MASGIEPSDAAVLRASLVEPAAFETLFTRHYDRIYRYLFRRAGSQAAEDLASQTFLEAFRVRDRYDLGRLNALPWLFGIATNLLRHHARDEQARLRACERQAMLAARVVPGVDEEQIDTSMRLALVTRVVRALEPRERDVLLLYAWQELTYEEIAEALEVPIGTVRSRLNRGRRAIREQLASDLARTGD